MTITTVITMAFTAPLETSKRLVKTLQNSSDRPENRKTQTDLIHRTAAGTLVERNQEEHHGPRGGRRKRSSTKSERTSTPTGNTCTSTSPPGWSANAGSNEETTSNKSEPGIRQTRQWVKLTRRNLSTSMCNSTKHSKSCVKQAWGTWLTLAMLIVATGITQARDDQKNYPKKEYHPRREYQSEATSNIIFTAYDCTRPVDNTYRSINLAQSRECRSFQHEYEEPEDTQATLVQINTHKVKVAVCQLMLSKHLTFYGVHAARGTFMNYVDRKQLFIDGKICIGLLKNRKFSCPEAICQGKVQQRITVPSNQTEIVSWYSHGGFDNTSKPIMEVFTPEGYPHPVTGAAEISTLAITLNEYDGEVDLPNNELTVPALNVKTDYQPSVSRRGDYGLLAWEQIHYQCKEGMSKIRRSNATIYRRKPEFPDSKDKYRTTGALPKIRNNHQLKGAVVVLHNEDEDKAESVVIQPGYHECLTECYRTNVRDVAICIGASHDLDDLRTQTMTSKTRLNMQAGVTRLRRVNHLDDLELGKRIHAKMCEKNHKMSGQDLAAGLNLRNPYVLQSATLPEPGNAGSTGRAITMRGVVGYVYKCTPRQVKLVQLSYCTQQIPCEVIDLDTGKARLAFADPMNFNLRDYPTKTPCTPQLPVQYLINGVYYCHSPAHSVCSSVKDPLTMGPFGSIDSSSHTIFDSDTYNFKETLTGEQLDVVRKIHERDEHGKVVIDNFIDDVISGTMLKREKGRPMEPSLRMPSINLENEPMSGTLFRMFKMIGQLYINIILSLTILSLTQYVLTSSRWVSGAQPHHYEEPDMYPVGATLKLLLAAVVFPFFVVLELADIIWRIIRRALWSVTKRHHSQRDESRSEASNEETDPEDNDCPSGQEDPEEGTDHQRGECLATYEELDLEETKAAINRLIKTRLDELKAAERRLRKVTEAVERDSHLDERSPVREIRERTIACLEEKIETQVHNIKKLKEFLRGLKPKKGCGTRVPSP